jgi:hypothetical protein
VVQKTYDVCVNKRVHSSAWFQAGLITSYIQTTESRNSVVEGTAQGNHLRGWGLSVVKGRAQHNNCQVHLWFRKKEENTPLDHGYTIRTVRHSSKEYGT